jgi:hypothetical protein
MLKALFAIIYILYAVSARAELPFNPMIEDGQSSYSVSPLTGNTRYDEKSYKRIGERVYEVSPMTGNVRYDKSSYQFKGGRVYEVSPLTGNIQYQKPSYVIK